MKSLDKSTNLPKQITTYLQGEMEQPIVFEQKVIQTVGYNVKTKKVIDLLFNTIEKLSNELKNLQGQLGNMQEEQKKFMVYEFKTVPAQKAKENIINYLKSIKRSRENITIFEISQKLRLPADQVETILEELAKIEKVSFL